MMIDKGILMNWHSIFMSKIETQPEWQSAMWHSSLECLEGQNWDTSDWTKDSSICHNYTISIASWEVSQWREWFLLRWRTESEPSAHSPWIVILFGSDTDSEQVNALLRPRDSRKFMICHRWYIEKANCIVVFGCWDHWQYIHHAIELAINTMSPWRVTEMEYITENRIKKDEWRSDH
jgi:hypothetical protein